MARRASIMSSVSDGSVVASGSSEGTDTTVRVFREIATLVSTSSPCEETLKGCSRGSWGLPRIFSIPIARTILPAMSQRKRWTSPRARRRSAVGRPFSGASTVSSVVILRSERKRRKAWAPWASSNPFMQKYWSAVSESITIRL